MSYSSAVDLITSSYDSSSSSDTASSELGKDAFLELLITQLEWQDPLDPMDDTEMVSQLAQFSSLEALEEVNEQLDSALEVMEQELFTQTTGYIGKEVEADGSTIVKDGDSVSTVTFTLGGDAASVYAHVVDTSGEIVASYYLGSLEAGDYSYVWDGSDSDGNEADDGGYYIAFSAYDEDDESLTVSTQVSGTVRSVYTDEDDGETYLELTDGRLIAASNVTKVVSTDVASADDE